jgi:hypothetical protein
MTAAASAHAGVTTSAPASPTMARGINQTRVGYQKDSQDTSKNE